MCPPICPICPTLHNSFEPLKLCSLPNLLVKRCTKMSKHLSIFANLFDKFRLHDNSFLIKLPGLVMQKSHLITKCAPYISISSSSSLLLGDDVLLSPIAVILKVKFLSCLTRESNISRDFGKHCLWVWSAG